MPALAVCPNLQAFKQALRGPATSAELEGLAQHLEACPRCSESVAELLAADTLLESVDRRAAARLPHGPAVEGLMERLSRLRLPARVPAVEETVAAGPAGPHGPSTAPPRGEATRELYTFLEPPQGPDEIGRLGGYRVLEVLGSGGMGVVFRAEDPQLKRQVALKALRPALDSDEQARQRFLREAQVTAALRHDHIVTIYQVGADRDVLFLAMELLEGMPLDRWLASGPKPTPAQILRLGREVALGLAAAHAKDLIHRDIKPGNLWLDATHDDRVKILDFGLARAIQEEVQLTQVGFVIGTPAYLAPEQARAEPVDARCDLFSLGCVLYRLCSGRLPFEGETALAVLAALALNDPKPIREVNPDIPPALADLVMRLLAKSPDDRPPTARAVVAMIRAIEQNLTGRIPQPPHDRSAAATQDQTAGKPARSPTPSLPSGRPGGASQRRRLSVLAGAAVLLGGLFAAGWVIIRDKDGKEVTRVSIPAGGSAEIKPGSDGSPLGGSGLDRLDPAAIPVEQRFDGQPKELVAVLGDSRLRHWSGISSLAFHPDNKTLIANSVTGAIRLWDLKTYRQRQQLGRSNETPVALSPDGKLLAWTKILETSIRLTDLGTGQERLLAGHKDLVYQRVFSGDGTKVASSGRDETVRLWDVATGKELLALKDQNSLWIALSPDGKLLATVTKDYHAIDVWDTATGAKRKRLTNEAGATNFTLPVFSPDGKVLAATADGVWLWNVNGWKRRPTLPVAGWIGALAFSPDSKLLAVGDQRFTLFDLASGQPRWRQQYQNILATAFSPDGKVVASGSRYGVIELWDVLTGKNLRPNTAHGGTLAGHASAVRQAAVTPDGRTLVSAGYDGTLRLWDLAGNSPRERRVWQLSPFPLNTLALGPDGHTAAVASINGSVWLQDLTADRPARALPNLSNWPVLTFSPDGRTLAGSRSKVVVLWDVASGKERHALKTSEDTIRELAFSSDGKVLAVADQHSGVQLWNPHTGQEIGTLPGLANGTMTVAFSPDNQRVAAFHFETLGLLWHVASRKELRRFDVSGTSAAFSPDGRSLAVAGFSDGILRLLDPATGALQREFKVGEPLNLNCALWTLCFAPDGRHLITANPNGTVYVFRLAPPPTATGDKRGLADKEKPFVLRSKIGGPRQDFKHLAEALAVLQDGNAIEVYGNGPFAVDKIELTGQGLRLRAAPGYRPLFHVRNHVTVAKAVLVLEGCDFRFESEADSITGGGAPWEIRGCRIWSVPLGGNHRCLSYGGPQLTVSDCLLRGYGYGFSLGARATLDLSNCLVHGEYCVITAAPGGQTIRLRQNTLHADLIHGFVGPEAISVDAEGNLFALPLVRGSEKDLKTLFRWHGRNNLHAGLKVGDLVTAKGASKSLDLAAWQQLQGRADEGSRQVKRVAFRWQELHGQALAATRQTLLPIIDDMRRRHPKINTPGAAKPDFGPNWDLIGPGEAHVRALAADGRPVAEANRRPPGLEGGPVVLLHEAKPVRGYPTLPEAVKEAVSGDVIEIRSDGRFSGCAVDLPGVGLRMLTLRAAPGYQPVVEGNNGIGFAASIGLTVEGLRFRNAGITDRPPLPGGRSGQLVRLANCTFEGQPPWQFSGISGYLHLGYHPEAGPRTEIVNCLIPAPSLIYLGSGRLLSIRNSVMEQIELGLPGAGRRRLELTRCVSVNASHRAYSALMLREPDAGGRLEVSAMGTLFQGGRLMNGYRPECLAGWKGERNVYRLGPVNWTWNVPGGTIFDVDGLRKRWNSPETGSVAELSPWDDSRQWQLLPTSAGYRQGPGGKDYGVDGDRLAHTPPAK